MTLVFDITGISTGRLLITVLFDMVIPKCVVAMVTEDGSLCIVMEDSGIAVAMVTACGSTSTVVCCMVFSAVGTSLLDAVMPIVCCLFKVFSMDVGVTEIGSFPNESR